MYLSNWDPFRELEDFNHRLNRAFGRSQTGERSNGNRDALTLVDWVPTVDIVETDTEFEIKAELPDLRKEDVKVRVDNGVLRIEGERRRETEDKTRKVHRVERSYGSFLRTFSLPEQVEEDKISAEFKDGVLCLRLPKSEKAKPKALEIKVS